MSCGFPLDREECINCSRTGKDICPVQVDQNDWVWAEAFRLYEKRTERAIQ